MNTVNDNDEGPSGTGAPRLADLTNEELHSALTVQKYRELLAAGVDMGFTPAVLLDVLLLIHALHAHLTPPLAHERVH